MGFGIVLFALGMKSNAIEPAGKVILIHHNEASSTQRQYAGKHLQAGTPFSPGDGQQRRAALYALRALLRHSGQLANNTFAQNIPARTRPSFPKAWDCASCELLHPGGSPVAPPATPQAPEARKRSGGVLAKVCLLHDQLLRGEPHLRGRLQRHVPHGHRLVASQLRQQLLLRQPLRRPQPLSAQPTTQPRLVCCRLITYNCHRTGERSSKALATEHNA